MTRSEFIKYLKRYHTPMACEVMAGYLNKLARGLPYVFDTEFKLSSDDSHLIDADPDTYFIVGVRNRGYTYVRNDKDGVLRCALTRIEENGERTIFLAKTPEEFCNAMIKLVLLR